MEARVFGEGIHRVGVREIVPSVYWITHCLGNTPHPQDAPGPRGRMTNLPYSCFLIVDEKSILLDTIGPIVRDNLFAALEFLLKGRPLDYVWVSHVELPHGGNASSLAKRYPKTKLVIGEGGDNYSLYGLEDAVVVSPGDGISLGEHELEFVEPVIVDHALTSWVYERRTGFLSTVDWGCNMHHPTECFRFLDELDVTKPYLEGDIVGQLRGAFSWLAWADAARLNRAVDRLFESLDVRILAPMHASVIRKDVREHVSLLKRSVEIAASMPPWWEDLPPDTRATS